MDSFLAHTDLPFRLLIVDNGSTDGTVEWLQEFSPQNERCQGVETHFYPRNMGIAIGRNKGLLMSEKYSDPWLSTVDNDVEFPEKWLSKCIEITKTNHKFAIGINFEGIQYPIQPINGKPVQFKSAGNLGTACTVFHRKLHRAIGFFTTDYGTLYGTEDANFFFRARKAGWQMGYLPENGVHFGVNEHDTGEYRTFKDACHKENLSKFQSDCYAYMSGKKNIYHGFVEPVIDIDRTANNKT